MKSWVSMLAATSVVVFSLSGCAALQGQDVGDDPVTDEGIASIATGRLNGDPMTARSTLSVEVDNGLATLYGNVPSEATRQRAIQILEGTPGIFEVLDRTRRR